MDESLAGHASLEHRPVAARRAHIREPPERCALIPELLEWCCARRAPCEVRTLLGGGGLVHEAGERLERQMVFHASVSSIFSFSPSSIPRILARALKSCDFDVPEVTPSVSPISSWV